MSRWDVSNFDDSEYKNNVEHEEARLLKKFEDYRQLERTELEKSRYAKEIPNKEKTQGWTNRFMSITIIQTFIITGLTVFLMFMEFVNYDVKLMASLLALGVLGSEIIFLSKYFRKRSSTEPKRDYLEFETKSEFDVI
jgi:hypothetical protein